jgi:hypothetical protein
MVNLLYEREASAWHFKYSAFSEKTGGLLECNGMIRYAKNKNPKEYRDTLKDHINLQ